jgi:hypothetical protein
MLVRELNQPAGSILDETTAASPSKAAAAADDQHTRLVERDATAFLAFIQMNDYDII